MIKLLLFQTKESISELAEEFLGFQGYIKIKKREIEYFKGKRVFFIIRLSWFLIIFHLQVNKEASVQFDGEIYPQ